MPSEEPGANLRHTFHRTSSLPVQPGYGALKTQPSVLTMMGDLHIDIEAERQKVEAKRKMPQQGPHLQGMQELKIDIDAELAKLALRHKRLQEKAKLSTQARPSTSAGEQDYHPGIGSGTGDVPPRQTLRRTSRSLISSDATTATKYSSSRRHSPGKSGRKRTPSPSRNPFFLTRRATD